MMKFNHITRIFAILIMFGFYQNSYAQYPNYRVSSPSSLLPEEVTISINPTNPQNLAAAANIDYYYYSFDGGLTWTEGVLTSSLGVAGDPCVRFDADGNLYYGHLSNPSGGSWLDRIVVQKSTDGGLSWNDGIGVGFFPPHDQDKEWITVDMTQSQYYNNIYMAWTEFDSYGSPSSTDSTRILFSRSTDSGENWDAPVRLSDKGGDCIDSDNTVEGAVPAVGPQGQVYVSWSVSEEIWFDKSLDGGVTFGVDKLVTSQPGGWDFNIPGIYRCNGFPITLCDISQSPYRGTVYVVFSDQRNGTDNTDIFLIKSTDAGETWSDVKTINNDSSNRHQFFPWAVIDQSTGYLYVVFYDRRNTAGDITDVFVAKSVDGGESFQNFQVSENSFTPLAWRFFGDYINIDAHEGKIYPIWTRFDGIYLSVWMVIIDEIPQALTGTGQSTAEVYKLYQNFPNPFNPNTIIKYYLPVESRVEIKIIDLTGKEIVTLVDEMQFPGEKNVEWNGRDKNNRPVSSGIYLYRLETEREILNRKMILVK